MISLAGWRVIYGLDLGLPTFSYRWRGPVMLGQKCTFPLPDAPHWEIIVLATGKVLERDLTFGLAIRLCSTLNRWRSNDVGLTR